MYNTFFEELHSWNIGVEESYGDLMTQFPGILFELS